MLRASVGEDNLAIEDFNFVLEREPDNMIALYNRALLLDNTGDYNGAIRDISAVINEYPQFWAGYQKRASIRRKIGDIYGAERDEFKIMQAQLAVTLGTYKSTGKTRKKSEKNIEDYDKLVEEDTHEEENEYATEYRGRVQNRQTELKPQHLYVLSYYRQEKSISHYVPFSKWVDLLNSQKKLPGVLYLTDTEGNLTETMIQTHFDHIAEATEKLEKMPNDSILLLQRALDYYHVRDFENAIADLNNLLTFQTDNVLALFLRAQVRCAELEASGTAMQAQDVRLGYLMALQDLTRCTELAPDFVYAHYNRGGVQILLADYPAAIESYTETLRLDNQFPAAYFNRGVAHLMSDKSDEGLSDLSQAGEYGLYSAYNLIKRYSTKKQK